MSCSSTCPTSCSLPAAAGCAGPLSLSDPHREVSSFPHTTAGDDYVLAPTGCFSSSRYPCPPSAVTGHSAADCATCCHGTQKMLLEANLPGQSPGLINFKHEFLTKKAGQLTQFCIFEYFKHQEKKNLEKTRDINMKIHESTQYS